MKPLFRVEPIDFESLGRQSLAPVQVAVIDSGVDATHPDLQGRIRCAWRASRNAKLEMTTVRIGGSVNQDEHGHGTAVAGIIAALAPNAAIDDYKIFAEGESTAGEGMLACLESAIDSGTRLINMSLAAKSTLKDKIILLIERAYRQGTMVVASQRNLPSSDLGLPAELSYCLGVDLHDENAPYLLHYRARHPISFIGRGESVIAPAPGGGYTEVTGTSFATPTVSALCVLLLGAYPELEPFEIKAILKAHAGQCVKAAER